MATSSALGTVTPSSIILGGPTALNPSRFSPRHASVSTHSKISNASMNARNCGQESDYGISSSSNMSSMNDQVTKVLSTLTAFGATALLTSTLFNVEAAHALDGVEVGAIFQRTCSGCHTGGGNILQPNATLFNKDLDSNGLSSVDDVYNVTYFGKNRMPGYGEKCTPRGQCTFGPRLGDDDIRALAEFVKSQADRGWTNVET